MPRVKRGTTHVKRRRNLLKLTKGFSWGHKKLIKRARVAALRAGVYSYRDRRTKKRAARKLWNIQINAAVRPQGLSYSRFIERLSKAGVGLDRKILSQIAREYPKVFEKIVEKVK